MTVLGLVTSADEATLWCDTMTIFGDEPGSHVDKLVLNKSARLMVAGTGASLILETARAVAAAAPSVEELIRVLPDELKRAVSAASAFYDVPEEAFSRKTTAVVAGWSARQQRIRAWRLRGASDFEPEIVSHHASPTVDGLATLHLPTREDLRGVAIEQVLALQRGYTFKIAGRVVLGTIRRNEVVADVLLDMDKEVGSIGPIEWPAAAALVEAT